MLRHCLHHPFKSLNFPSLPLLSDSLSVSSPPTHFTSLLDSPPKTPSFPSTLVFGSELSSGSSISQPPRRSFASSAIVSAKRSDFSVDFYAEMNCRPPCFLDVDWERSMGSSVSLVPSESLSLTDIGQLGRICSSGEITPQSQYITDLNSPPELHLSITDHHHQQQLDNGGLPVPGNPMLVPHLTPFSVDPRFVDRTAMFSSFGGGRNCGGLAAQFGLLEAGKLSTDASCRSLGTNRSQMGVSGKYKEIPMLDGPQLEMGSGDFGNAREESSVSDPISAGESNPRKRKAIPKSKAKGHAKITEGDDSMAKRCRSAEFTRTEKDEIKPKIEQNGDHEQKQRKGDNVKPIDPPKQDFIHVRARRGEATDSHSLAERVRREKISERMKLLQDLVPGCNKVTGKALMLDEIINYVQSLQQQVEFLSMKLASVNPQLGFNMESHLPRDIHQVIGSSTNSVYPAFSDARQPQQGTSLQCVASNGLETRCSANPLEPTLHQSLSMQLPSLDRVGYATSQLGTFWENDFQNVAQLGFHDPFHVAHMKTER